MAQMKMVKGGHIWDELVGNNFGIYCSVALGTLALYVFQVSG